MIYNSLKIDTQNYPSIYSFPMSEPIYLVKIELKVKEFIFPRKRKYEKMDDLEEK